MSKLTPTQMLRRSTEIAQAEAAGRGSTRTRILEASRDLFNARGPGDVTTAEIAAASGISEGNLHYHFRRKEQIVEALFACYEAALEQTVAENTAMMASAHNDGIYLQGYFATMWEWRFIYSGSSMRIAPKMAARLTRLTERAQADVKRVLFGLVARDILIATPAQIDMLIVNAWIVASYWIDYLQSRQGVAEITRAHLDQGLAQVEALFQPFLREDHARTRRAAHENLAAHQPSPLQTSEMPNA